MGRDIDDEGNGASLEFIVAVLVLAGGEDGE